MSVPKHPNFDIRSQSSTSQLQLSQCTQQSFQQTNGNDISKIIQSLINQQKRKNLPSKTDPYMNLFVGSDTASKSSSHIRRLYSISNVSSQVRKFQSLPKNIQQILNTNRKYPNLPMLDKNQDQLDRIYGAFFGFFIGDVVGSHMAYTTADCSSLIPLALMMNGGGTYNLGPGQGTDQSELMLSLCYGLMEGKGHYQQNLIAKKYLQWFQSKPFNFSAVFALAMKDLRKMKTLNLPIDQQQISKILLETSTVNKKQQSSIGLIRVLPLVVFSLNFSNEQFQNLIRGKLSFYLEQMQLICPNLLVIESAFVYANIIRTIILNNDQERAFYQASKWVYQHGCLRLKQLWQNIETRSDIPSKGNMGKLKTSFTYSCIELTNKDLNFVDSMINILRKGGDTQTNCAIVMAMVGAIVGYNSIPSYLKQKIVNSRMSDSPRPRDEIYSPHKVIDVVSSIINLHKLNDTMKIGK